MNENHSNNIILDSDQDINDSNYEQNVEKDTQESKKRK